MSNRISQDCVQSKTAWISLDVCILSTFYIDIIFECVLIWGFSLSPSCFLLDFETHVRRKIMTIVYYLTVSYGAIVIDVFMTLK